MQSACKVSCSRIALKRCTSTETRQSRKLVSLISPVLKEILLPISFNRAVANTESLNGDRPKDTAAVCVCTFALPYGMRQPLPLHLPQKWYHSPVSRLKDKSQRHPNTTTCSCAMGRVPDHKHPRTA